MSATSTESVNITDAPIVVLFEDRPKQCMVYQLNLSVYLDARVTVANDLTDFKRALAGPEGVQLVVARANFKDGAVVKEVADFLKEAKQNIQVISLGGGPELPGVTVVGDDTLVKPMLQNAARILGVTARMMVGKTRPDHFKISPDFLKLLFTFPCDIYEESATGRAKVFAMGESVARGKVNRLARNKKSLIIDSFERLRLANAVTEQSQLASEAMNADALDGEKKIAMLSASLDMVSAQFKNAGMDAETVELANASIKAIEKIAESSTSVGNLVRQLMDSEGGYRYAHAQLLTFLGFHVIKMMGWWGDEQRNIISQAAFYHDISLDTDDDGKFRTERQLSESVIKDPKRVEKILTHAQLAARELQSMPEISPDVVRVVLQHHGSPIGRGYSTEIEKLENLAKAFILSEEWADYLIELSDTEAEPDNEGKAAALKLIYKDEVSQHIIETFRYLEPEAFSSDFLEAVDVQAALAPPPEPARTEPPTLPQGVLEPEPGKAAEAMGEADETPKGAYRGEGDNLALSEAENELVETQLPEGSQERAAFKAASKATQKVMLEKLKKKKRLQEEKAKESVASAKEEQALVDEAFAGKPEKLEEFANASPEEKQEILGELQKKKKKTDSLEQTAEAAVGRPLNKVEKALLSEEIANDPEKAKEFEKAGKEEKQEILAELKKKKKRSEAVDEAMKAAPSRALSREEKALLAEDPEKLEEFKAANDLAKEEILAELKEKKERKAEVEVEAEKAVGRKLTKAEKELLAEAYADDPKQLEELQAGSEEEKEEALADLKKKKKRAKAVDEAVEESGGKALSKREKELLAEEASEDPGKVKEFLEASPEEKKEILEELAEKKKRGQEVAEEAQEAAPRKLTKEEKELLAKAMAEDSQKLDEFKAANEEEKEEILEDLKKKKKRKEAVEEAADQSGSKALTKEEKDLLAEEASEEPGKVEAFLEASPAEKKEIIEELKEKRKRGKEVAEEAQKAAPRKLTKEEKELLAKEGVRDPEKLEEFKAASKEAKEEILEGLKKKKKAAEEVQAAEKKKGKESKEKSAVAKARRSIEQEAPEAEGEETGEEQELSDEEEKLVTKEFGNSSEELASFKAADKETQEEILEALKNKQALEEESEGRPESRIPLDEEDRELVEKNLPKGSPERAVFAQANKKAKAAMLEKIKTRAALEEFALEDEKDPGALSVADEAVAAAAFPERSPARAAFEKATPQAKKAMLEEFKNEQAAAVKEELEAKIAAPKKSVAAAKPARSAKVDATKVDSTKVDMEAFKKADPETRKAMLEALKKQRAERFGDSGKEEETARTLKDVTHKRKDEARKISADAPEEEDSEERSFKPEDGEDEAEQKFTGERKGPEASRRLGADGATGKAGEKKFSPGDEAGSDAEQVFGKDKEEEEEERRFQGGDERDDSEKRISGVTDVRNDGKRKVAGSKEEVDKSEQRFKGDKDEADTKKTKVENVTEKINTGEFLSKGEKQEVDKTKRAFGGATDVRNDGKIVVKDNAQKLVDKSIAKKVEGGKEAERELKMKSVTGATDLMKACLGEALESVAELLTANISAQLRKTDAEGRTCFHYAAMGGHRVVLKFLLEKGAQLNAVDAKRRSALFLAALHKQNEAFDFILGQGAKIAQQAMGGMNVAMVAAFTNNLHIMKIAVQKKVRLDTADHSGKNVHEYAKLAKATDILNYLEAIKQKGPEKRVPGTHLRPS